MIALVFVQEVATPFEYPAGGHLPLHQRPHAQDRLSTFTTPYASLVREDDVDGG